MPVKHTSNHVNQVYIKYEKAWGEHKHQVFDFKILLFHKQYLNLTRLVTYTVRIENAWLRIRENSKNWAFPIWSLSFSLYKVRVKILKSGPVVRKLCYTWKMQVFEHLHCWSVCEQDTESLAAAGSDVSDLLCMDLGNHDSVLIYSDSFSNVICIICYSCFCSDHGERQIKR